MHAKAGEEITGNILAHALEHMLVTYYSMFVKKKGGGHPRCLGFVVCFY